MDKLPDQIDNRSTQVRLRHLLTPIHSNHALFSQQTCSSVTEDRYDIQTKKNDKKSVHELVIMPNSKENENLLSLFRLRYETKKAPHLLNAHRFQEVFERWCLSIYWVSQYLLLILYV